MVSQYIGETFKDLNNMNYRLRISQSIVRQQWEFFTGFCCLNVTILCIFMRNLQGLNSVNHTALIVLIPLCNIKRLKQLYSPRCSDVLRHSALLLFMACIERRLKVWGFPVNCNFLLTGFLSCKAWFHLGFLRKWSSGVFFLFLFFLPFHLPTCCHHPATSRPAQQLHVPGISCGTPAIIFQSSISSSQRQKAFLLTFSCLKIQLPASSHSFAWVCENATSGTNGKWFATEPKVRGSRPLSLWR